LTPEDELQALLEADALLQTDALLDAIARRQAPDSCDPAVRLLAVLLDDVAVDQRRSSVSMTPST
jgi:hypothetical protein